MPLHECFHVPVTSCQRAEVKRVLHCDATARLSSVYIHWIFVCGIYKFCEDIIKSLSTAEIFSPQQLHTNRQKFQTLFWNLISQFIENIGKRKLCGIISCKFCMNGRAGICQEGTDRRSRAIQFVKLAAMISCSLSPDCIRTDRTSAFF